MNAAHEEGSEAPKTGLASKARSLGVVVKLAAVSIALVPSRRLTDVKRLSDEARGAESIVGEDTTTRGLSIPERGNCIRVAFARTAGKGNDSEGKIRIAESASPALKHFPDETAVAHFEGVSARGGITGREISSALKHIIL